MKIKRLVAHSLFALIAAAGLIATDSVRWLWVLLPIVGGFGILVFDTYQTVTEKWVNVFGFNFVIGLILMACLAPSAEFFWAYSAGAFWLTALCYESNSAPWSGETPFKSPLFAAILFTICSMARGLPFLSAEQVLLFEMLAISAVVMNDLFSLMREKSELMTGGYVQGLRTLTTGTLGLFYVGTFLPEVARKTYLVALLFVFVALGLVAALLSFFVEDSRRGHTLFVTSWLAFILWAGLAGPVERLYVAMGAVGILTWAGLVAHRRGITFTSVKELFLRLTAWGIPGSVLFGILVLLLAPTDEIWVQRGSVAWLVVFFIHALAISRQEWKKSPEKEVPWSWRQSLGLFVNVAGAGLLACLKMYPQLLGLLKGL